MHLSQGGAWRDWDDSSTTATAQNPDQAPDERATNALHTMQDHLQQTIVISQRLAQKMLSDLHQRQWAMLPARTWSPPRTHALCKQRQNEQKCQEPVEAETIVIDTTRNTVEKTDALKKHRKTVTMRAESRGGKLLRDAPRPPGRTTETPERALSAAKQARHGWKETFAARVDSSQPTLSEVETSGLRPDAWKSSLVTGSPSVRVFEPVRNKVSTEGTPDVRVSTHGGETHRCLRSE